MWMMWSISKIDLTIDPPSKNQKTIFNLKGDTTMRKDIIVDLFKNKKNNGCRFCSITYAPLNNPKEVSRYVINVGVSIKKIYEKDLELLTNIKKEIAQLKNDNPEMAKALANEVTVLDRMITNLKASISGYVEGIMSATDSFYKTIAPGIKQHKRTKEIYITGMLQSKTVLKKSKKLFVPAKETPTAKFRKLLRSSKIRQFKVTPETVKTIKYDGMVISLGGGLK